MGLPKYVRALEKKEKGQIEHFIRKESDARVVRRAQTVRLSAQGKKCHEIADLLGFSIPTIHRVIDSFNKEGISALPDKPRSGRPKKATNEYIGCLKEAVAVSPIDMGYSFASWTLPRLREHPALKCGVLLNPDYLSRLMARHGIVYRRPKHIMSHLRDQDEYDEKKEIINFLKKARSNRKKISTSYSSTSVRFTSTRP